MLHRQVSRKYRPPRQVVRRRRANSGRQVSRRYCSNNQMAGRHQKCSELNQMVRKISQGLRRTGKGDPHQTPDGQGVRRAENSRLCRCRRRSWAGRRHKRGGPGCDVGDWAKAGCAAGRCRARTTVPPPFPGTRSLHYSIDSLVMFKPEQRGEPQAAGRPGGTPAYRPSSEGLQALNKGLAGSLDADMGSYLNN